MNHKDTKSPSIPIPETTEQVAGQVVDSAFKVHSALGPGLLESIYETCMVHELTKRGLPLKRQVALPIRYDGLNLEGGLRLDLVVDNCVVVELKAVEALHPIHQAQVLTYLKLSGHRLALLINFNVPLIKQGIRRVVL